jgi:hypothetical protein
MRQVYDTAGTFLAQAWFLRLASEGGASVAAEGGTRVRDAESYYLDAINDLMRAGVPFMVGGAYAMRAYADVYRDTKDLDIFCKARDYPSILETLADRGYGTELTDANWLAKAFHGDYYVDVIFNSRNGLCPVDDSWFEHARPGKILDVDVGLVPPEEQLWTKLYVQDRHRFDGADVNHIIRKMGPELDWKRILGRLEVHWELLLQSLVHFRFVYPSEDDRVPHWLMEELLDRMRLQETMPPSKDPVCRGPMVSHADYDPDIVEWGYKPR